MLVPKLIRSSRSVCQTPTLQGPGHADGRGLPSEFDIRQMGRNESKSHVSFRFKAFKASIIDHPPVISIIIGGINHSQSWVVNMALF